VAAVPDPDDQFGPVDTGSEYWDIKNVLREKHPRERDPNFGSSTQSLQSGSFAAGKAQHHAVLHFESRPSVFDRMKILCASQSGSRSPVREGHIGSRCSAQLNQVPPDSK